MAILKLEPQLANNSANFTFGNVFASNFYYANGTLYTTGGGSAGASVTVSGTEPSSPSEGDLWFDTSVSLLKIYVSATWESITSSGGGGGGTYVNRKYTANGTSGAYTVTSGCGVNNVLVFLNGICQMPTDDYTISGTTLTLDAVPASGTLVQIRELPR